MYFINLSLAKSGFKKEDYFEAPESDLRKTDWLWKTSYTAKGGLNYNVSERSNVFMNLGYLSKNRASTYIYQGYDAKFRENTDNEIIQAVELGYSYNSPSFAGNINVYNTKWSDKPINEIDVGEEQYVRIDAIDLLHRGVEVDFVYKILHNLEFQGLASLGDWRYKTFIANVPIYDEYSHEQVGSFTFDAEDVHVGDAAQTQVGTSVRYEPFKGMYINTRFTYFAKYNCLVPLI